MSTRFKGLQGVSQGRFSGNLMGVYISFKAFQLVSGSFKGLQKASRELQDTFKWIALRFIAFKWVSRGSWRFQRGLVEGGLREISYSLRGFRCVSKRFRGFQQARGASRKFSGFQEVSWGFRGFRVFFTRRFSKV